MTQSHAKIEKKLASLLEGDETDMGHKEIQVPPFTSHLPRPACLLCEAL